MTCNIYQGDITDMSFSFVYQHLNLSASVERLNELVSVVNVSSLISTQVPDIETPCLASEFTGSLWFLMLLLLLLLFRHSAKSLNAQEEHLATSP